jgi:uncharacterized protein YdgA (DUF945 family)
LKVRKYTGVKVEEKHARAISQAITNFVLAALARETDRATIHGQVRGYLESTVPDAMEALRPAEMFLSTKVQSVIASAAGKGG